MAGEKLTFIILIILFFFAEQAAYACFGARQMAMGGAFTGLADDAYSAYWNPAGLGTVQEELVYTGTMPQSRDAYNHDDFLAYVFSLSRESKYLGNLAVWLVDSGFNRENYDDKEYWYGLAYGQKLFENFYAGLSSTYVTYRKSSSQGNDDDDLGTISLSFLYKLDKLSLGLLLQDMNRPRREIFDTEFQYIYNVRPGLAYRISDHTTFTFDIYDLLGQTKGDAQDVSQDLRFGFEHWLSHEFALRFGAYHPNSADDASQAITVGFGLNPEENMKLFGQNQKIGFDYALMYWLDPPANTGNFTHQVGFRIMF